MKDLRDYIHLYIGCLVQYPDTDPDATMVIAKLTGVSEGDGVETTYLEVKKHAHGETHGDYLAWKSNGNHNSDALHLKLILRPLSDITKEEANEAWILGGGSNAVTNRIYAIQHLVRYTHLYRGGMVRIVNYLRKHGFDLDDLEEAGFAVYKTDIKKS